MTVTYSLITSTSSHFQWIRLMFRWKGSIWRNIWQDLLSWLIAYTAIGMLYRRGLNEDQKRTFETVVLYCNKYLDFGPIAFMLGFYVSLVVSRWWDIYNTIDFPDGQLLHLSVYIPGTDEQTRIIRRQLARYLNLTHVLVLREIAPGVKKRFPTMQHLVDAGLFTAEELIMFNNVQSVHSKYWVPIQWCCGIVEKCREQGLIKSDYLLNKCMDEIMKTRTRVGTLFGFDWVPIPLVYPQIVELVVRSYFAISVVARQYLDPKQGLAGYEVDLYYPPFTLLQFVFIFGWLKVAEVLMNPLGEDDDDFDLNYIIDRNIQIAYTITDVNYGIFPEPTKDIYIDEPDAILPYTKALKDKIKEPVKGSANELTIPTSESDLIYPIEARGSTQVSRRSSQISRKTSKLVTNLRKITDTLRQRNENIENTQVSPHSIKIETEHGLEMDVRYDKLHEDSSDKDKNTDHHRHIISEEHMPPINEADEIPRK